MSLLPRMMYKGIRTKFSSVQHISTDSLQTLLDDKVSVCTILLVDVRENEEYKISRLLSNAIHVSPGSDLQPLLNKIINTPGIKTVVAYCSVGYRSSQLIERLQMKLEEYNFESRQIELYNLEGSIFKWANEGKPVFDEEGNETCYVHPYNEIWGKFLNVERRRYSAETNINEDSVTKRKKGNEEESNVNLFMVMELPDLGDHCSLSSCRQLDFLPFNCDACGKIYCKDHVKYENHNCTSGLRKDRKVPVCPLCSQPVSLSASENPDHKVNEHIENDCKSDLAKHKRSGKCGVKGCKKRELIPVLCSACKRNFCLRHRHETDHDCQAQTSNRTHQSSAAIQAGRASSSRYNQSLSRNKPTTSRQQTNLSSIGGDLNRARNERQQQASSARMASTVQRTNMSEDEALALAMEASLADTKPKDPTDKKSQAESTDATGDADMALARAIAESEKDERERQRRLNGQPTENNKNSCVLS